MVKTISFLILSPYLRVTISFLQIKRLITKYIQKQETINLVVVPSNVDIATTEALSMAQEVDPEGDRTIGKESGRYKRCVSANEIHLLVADGLCLGSH